MTRRKGEISDLEAQMDPSRRASGRKKCGASRTVNSELIFCAAGVLSANPLTYSMRGDDLDFVVFCFAKPEDAEAFAKRFGGELLRPGR
jgi:hypothetical protein